MPKLGKLAVLLCASSVLAGCATTPDDADGRLSAADPLGALHSEFNAMLSLVVTADGPSTCDTPGCGPTGALEKRIAAIGPRLVGAAFEQHPAVEKRIRKF